MPIHTGKYRAACQIRWWRILDSHIQTSVHEKKKLAVWGGTGGGQTFQAYTLASSSA